jgi:ATP-dependent DNA ligase
MNARQSVKIAPMEARLVEDLPADDGWQFEPKWDGFRCLVFRNDTDVELRGKTGKVLNRFFPDVVAAVKTFKSRHFIIDGELVIVVEGVLSFSALQARLHPAESRVAMLSQTQPAQFIAFDCLARGSKSLVSAPLSVRRTALEALLQAAPAEILLSPYARDLQVAQKWLAKSGSALDGVIAKRLDGPYVAGERAMLKVKRRQSADCLVAGFRYETDAKVVGSLLLGLYDDAGLLHHVGFTAALGDQDRVKLTRQLKSLEGGPGFTGKAPGKSRWSTARTEEWIPLKPKLVVEISFDQVTDGRIRHGTRLLRWRLDKAPNQCTFDQLEPPARPAEIAQLFGPHR